MYVSDQGRNRTLEHEAKCLPGHAASIDAHTGRSESRCCRCHQVSSAGDVATATDDGAARRLDKAAHGQVCSNLVPQCREYIDQELKSTSTREQPHMVCHKL